jgi:spore maturation protein CgeB
MGRRGTKVVVFGLSVSSSWGNGHATLWRGLARALADGGHSLVFFEKDVPYYAEHRDLTSLPSGELVLYREPVAVLERARAHLRDADVAIVTSYCACALEWTDLVLAEARGARVFYDMDAPVTLERARAGETVEYLGPRGLAGFDLVLSFTGGRSLQELAERFGARRVAALYGSVDPERHKPLPSPPAKRWTLSYLGTYAACRQPTLESLFLEPARLLPEVRFAIGGSMYPADFPWRANVDYLRHVAPPEHAAFYGASRFTLNVTRAEMAAMGHCPSGRLFEAAACGVPCLTDAWEGLEEFFEPGVEIEVVRSPDDVVAALSMPSKAVERMGQAARERALARHTSDRRAAELLALVQGVRG